MRQNSKKSIRSNAQNGIKFSDQLLVEEAVTKYVSTLERKNGFGMMVTRNVTWKDVI